MGMKRKASCGRVQRWGTRLQILPTSAELPENLEGQRRLWL